MIERIADSRREENALNACKSSSAAAMQPEESGPMSALVFLDRKMKLQTKRPTRYSPVIAAIGALSLLKDQKQGLYNCSANVKHKRMVQVVQAGAQFMYGMLGPAVTLKPRMAQVRALPCASNGSLWRENLNATGQPWYCIQEVAQPLYGNASRGSKIQRQSGCANCH